jgi:ABC-type transport system involved in Fe-S cluster assembly fused permease/ATPase subunit
MRPGSVEELCRILPEGVGIIPLFLDIQRGAREEFTNIIPHYEPLIAKLAEHEVNLIHPEGAPPFMVLGYREEAELIKKWEKKYKIPIFTSGTNHIRALHALKVKRFVGASYFPGNINQTFGQYFEDAGFEVLGMEDDKPDRPGARPAPAIVRELRFENVTFEYRDGQPVVREFQVTVPGGSVVALVGRSGAGKTTVTDLVARFHDPTRGHLLLNGIDIRDLQLRSYRDLLAIVQQDVFLFDGSVRDNIAYGRHDARDADIQDAARRANAHEFIERLPSGYETFIGERGVKLSGGQQQRLAIARAILASPQILILDEATSNLDTESEQLIQASMADLLADRTTFVIAHRLSTIRRADLILLMENGAVVERGTHEELMRAKGVYHDMVQRQIAAQARAGDEVFTEK